MTNVNDIQASTSEDLDNASLDLVVGGGVMVPDVRGDSSSLRVKQEQNDKLGGGEVA